MKPKTRVIVGKWLLYTSLAAIPVVHVIYFFDLIGSETMILVNLDLSLFALALTAADFLNTSDVSTKQ